MSMPELDDLVGERLSEDLRAGRDARYRTNTAFIVTQLRRLVLLALTIARLIAGGLAAAAALSRDTGPSVTSTLQPTPRERPCAFLATFVLVGDDGHRAPLLARLAQHPRRGSCRPARPSLWRAGLVRSTRRGRLNCSSGAESNGCGQGQNDAHHEDQAADIAPHLGHGGAQRDAGEKDRE